MTKKALIAVVLLVVAASIGLFVGTRTLRITKADSVNLIQNPTFTADSSNVAIPQGWLFGSNGTNDASATYPVVGPSTSNTAMTAVGVTINSYTNGFADWFPAAPSPVTPFAQYQFSDFYNANVPTIVEADYTITGTSTQLFTDITSLPATNGVWANANATFVAPQGATSVTIFHLINSVGTLSVADPSLIETAGPQTFAQGMVSLTFDDGVQTQYDVAYPMLKAAGLPGTFYIISQSMQAAAHIGTSTGDINNNYMTPDEVLTLNAAGNEIGDHTVNHCNLVTGLCPDADVANSPDPLSATQEISQAKQALLDIGGVPVDTFSYPYGTYNTTLENDLQQAGIIAGRSVDAGYNLANSNPYTLEIQYVNASTVTDADFQNTVKPWIDYAVTNKVWLILLFHQIESPATIAQTQDPDATTPQMLQDVVNYLKQNNVKTVTVHDAVCMMTGMGSNPNCANPIVYPIVPVTPTSTPPVTPTSTPNPTEAPEFRILNVTVTGLTNGDITSIMTTDSTNGTTVTRTMGDWSAPFLIPTGNPFTTAVSTLNNNYTVTMSQGCSGTLLNDTSCTITFTHK